MSCEYCGRSKEFINERPGYTAKARFHKNVFGEWYLNIVNDYGDGQDVVNLYIPHCPWCGEKLGDEQ